MMHDGWMFGMGWLWLLVVILVVAAIWIALRTGSRAGAGETGRPLRERSTPEEVLRDRFARGDIDEQEYRSRLRTLQDRT